MAQYSTSWPDEGYQLALESIELGAMDDNALDVRLLTDGGAISGRLYEPVTGNTGVVWIGGARGGLDGPAGGMYRRLGKLLLGEGIASISLRYRYPNQLVPSVLDALLGVEYLRGLRRSRIVVVGHAFGGAVAIAAGANSGAVAGVATLATQTYGADSVAELSPKPLLLVHGGADEVLPVACSHFLYHRAREPKKMLLYPGCRHELDSCRERLEIDLMGWLLDVLLKSPEEHAVQRKVVPSAAEGAAHADDVGGRP